jgi:hypothetical protein
MSEERRTPRLIFRPQPVRGSRADEARLAAAREKAAHYRDPDAHPAPPEERPRTGVRDIETWSDLAGQRIEEAMRRGDFDNLSGRGKPQRDDTNPFVPQDQQMAFRLLQNNDLVPDWIAERREVLRGVEEWRRNMRQITDEARLAWVAADSDARRFQLEQTWARWLDRWQDEIVEINRRINNLNLKQPIVHLEVFKLRFDDELRHAGATRKIHDLGA